MLVTLVLLKIADDENGLFVAPSGVYLNPGDTVGVLWDEKEQHFEVKAECTVFKESDLYRFVLECFNVPQGEELPRILYRVRYENFEYESERSN